MAIGPSVFDCQVLPLIEPVLSQTTAKCINQVCAFPCLTRTEKTNHRQGRLLPQCITRPHERICPNASDELPAPHGRPMLQQHLSYLLLPGGWKGFGPLLGR